MNVSIVIVTRNRSMDLIHCMTSLTAQESIPDELVVIDNNSTDETPTVVKAFSKRVRFPVRYEREERVGYPIVYNRGIRTAKYPWVAFLDDDCVAAPTWLKSMKTFLKHESDIAALLGNTQTYYKENVFSLLYSFKERVWKNNAMQGHFIVDLEVLDNKNIVYNKRFLKEKGLSFNENRVRHFLGASEDCDLGMQLQVNNGRAFYCEGMLAYHKDPVTSTDYYTKIARITRAHMTYEKHWSVVRRRLRFNFSLYRGVKYLNEFLSEAQLSTMGKIFFLLHLVLSFIIVKVHKIYGSLQA